MTSWRDTIEIHPFAADFPRMSEDELRELGEDIKKQEKLTSPIAICLQHPMDDTFQLVDGCNRLDAMELVGVTFEFKQNRDNGIWRLESDGLEFSRCHQVLPDEVLAYVISANVHRRHLNRDDKRDRIAKLINANPEKSDRQIAETVKVSPTTVGTVRAKLEETGDVSKLDTSTDTRGRKQPRMRARKSSRIAPQVPIRDTKSAAYTKDDVEPQSPGDPSQLQAVQELQAEDGATDEPTAARELGLTEQQGADLNRLQQGYLAADVVVQRKFVAWLGGQTAGETNNTDRDKQAEPQRESLELINAEFKPKETTAAQDDDLDIPAYLRRAPAGSGS
jgi:ParB-like chromosome segregation protein Spo0J